MEPRSLAQLMQKAGEFWRQLTPGTRRMIIGLVAAAVVSVALAYALNRPTLVPLGQYDLQDTGAITTKLTQLKVPYEPGSDDQTIMVAKKDLFTARLAAAQAGVNHGGTTGYELFDTPQFGATELEQRLNMRRALEGELARALMRLKPVERAQVRLALPEESAFIRQQQPPTAAVLLQLRSGAQLSPPEVAGLMRFVASSVPGLTAAAVSVIDERGRLISDGAGGGPEDTSVQTRQRLDLEKAMEARVQALLEPVFGRSNVVAKVSLDLDLSKRTIESHSLLPNPAGEGLVRSQEQRKETSLNVTPAAPAPAGTGAPTAPPQYVGDTGQIQPGSEKTYTVINYDFSEQKLVEVSAPGGIRRVTAGVVINASADGLAPGAIDQVRQTVASALGAGLADVTVSALPFRQQQTLQDLFKEPAPAPATLPAWALPGAGAAVAGLLLLWLLLLGLRRRRPSAPIGADWPGLAPPPPPPGPAGRGGGGRPRPPAAPRGGGAVVGEGRRPDEPSEKAAAATKVPPGDAAHKNGDSPTGGRNGTNGHAGRNGTNGHGAPDGANGRLRNIRPMTVSDLLESPDAAAVDLSPEALLAGMANSDTLPNPKLRDQIEKVVRHQPDEAAAILRIWLSERRR